MVAHPGKQPDANGFHGFSASVSVKSLPNQTPLYIGTQFFVSWTPATQIFLAHPYLHEALREGDENAQRVDM